MEKLILHPVDPPAAPDPRPDKPRVRQLKFRTFSTVTPTKTAWLWRGYIPLGTLTILDGDPGLGKSTITVDLAARVSRGRLMPPLSGRTDLSAPADVLILSAEDSAEQTIRPRLDAAGADVGRVHTIDATAVGEDGERPPILPTDLDLVEELTSQRGVKLIIIDPFMAYLDGELNAHKDQDVRRCLHRLKTLAENTGAAVVLVRHLNKLNGGPALYRGGGSIGITGAARSALVVGENPAEPKQLILAPVKCNLSAMPPALTYSVCTADNGAAVVGWGEETTLTADDILGNPRRTQTVAGECAELIRGLLADGPKPAEDMEGELKANGYSGNAIREGRKAAKVKAVRQGFGDSGAWYWQLSEDTEGNADNAQVPPGW